MKKVRAQIYLRAEKLPEYAAAAQAENRTLSQWIDTVCEKEIKLKTRERKAVAS